jgi:hypothetical protein
MCRWVGRVANSDRLCYSNCNNSYSDLRRRMPSPQAEPPAYGYANGGSVAVGLGALATMLERRL